MKSFSCAIIFSVLALFLSAGIFIAGVPASVSASVLVSIDVAKTDFVVDDGRGSKTSWRKADVPAEICSNSIEILEFMSNLRFLDEGDSHYVVEFFVQYCQVSTNFCSYGFARDPRNSKLERLRIHFIGADGRTILSVPCVNGGHDMAWDMEGVRLVKLHGSFILTRERCERLKDAVGMYISDKNENLLSVSGDRIIHNFTKAEIEELVCTPLSKMNENSKRQEENR